MIKSIVYNEDNRFGLDLIPSKAIDLIVDDPPYFSGPQKRQFYGSEIGFRGVKRGKYPIIKNWSVPQADYFKELERVSKNQIIWGCNYFDYPFGPGRIIWDKVNGNSSFSDCEIAFCSIHDSVRLFRYMWNGMMQGKSLEEGWTMQGNKKLNEKRIHQCQKPVILYDWIFSKYTTKGMTVADFHTGSGSSRIAAYKAGLDYYGWEADPVCWQDQEDRFNAFLESCHEEKQIQHAY